MRRIIVIACVLCFAALPAVADSWLFGHVIDVSAQVGLAYAGAWDPGFSGAGVEEYVQARRDWYEMEAGVEAALSPIGWQLLVPLRAGVVTPRGPLTGSLLVEVSPGLSLTRPALFMIGLGGVARAEWDITTGFGLSLGAGIRLTLCPAYAQYTGAVYQSVDVPVTLGMRWSWTQVPESD